MRISDWSSDVCSSDLHQHAEAGQRAAEGKGDPGEQRQEQRQNCAFDHIDAIRDADAEQFPERNEGQRQNRGEEKQSPVGDVERRGSSEERRVGKEGVSKCHSRWSPYHIKKNINNERHMKTKRN